MFMKALQLTINLMFRIFFVITLWFWLIPSLSHLVKMNRRKILTMTNLLGCNLQPVDLKTFKIPSKPQKKMPWLQILLCQLQTLLLSILLKLKILKWKKLPRSLKS
eukprot:NODE_15_length_50561_cov_0.608081.p36 type:complete len:106 gc:universal NODE_15_length_50561_cov_0.608081:32382-32699(+)